MTLNAFIRKAVPVAGASTALAMIFSPAMNARSGGSVPPYGPAAAPKALPQNPAYRIQVYSKERPTLPVTQDWLLQYQFTVPALPSSPTWNYKMGTVYQWGDVDFDYYGSSGSYKISGYRFNQIVPQLILGSVLDGNTNYRPSWSQRNRWAIQAGYYWYREPISYAQTGNVVEVNPGDEITTTISYKAEPGTIVASIRDDKIPGAAGVSTITISRPFPNDSLFTSWRDFFNKAAAASKTSYVLSTPAVDVETYYLDEQTMCGLLPLTLGKISIPGIALKSSAFSIQQLGGFTCRQPMVKLNF